MKIIDYFFTLPDENLIMLAINDWDDLEMLCYALTLDLYMFDKEQNYSS